MRPLEMMRDDLTLGLGAATGGFDLRAQLEHYLHGPPQPWVGWVGVVLAGIGLAIAGTLLVTDPHSLPRRAWAKHIANLEREVRFLLLKTSGRRIARAQLGVLVGLILFAFFSETSFLYFLLPLVVVGPMWRLTSMHEQRVALLEQQLDQWLLMLANALKATPSLGEAIASTTKLMRAPWGEELDLVLKEIALGTPIDQALLSLSQRINSRTISGSLTAILVGRQTGGDMSRILEESAATLREMSRLEGVVRTKTAEGKSQAYVLAVIPFILVGMIHMLDPHWLGPLFSSTVGWSILAGAFILWAVAIFLAKKILAVDV